MPAANKAETKRDPFADEIAMRLAMRRLATVQPKDPKTMTMAEILEAIDQLAAHAGRLAHG
ncbi:hypothetical protein ACC754_13740 [Rhizobium johnstonii]|uniref:hypothetical protein n=1 Tax=Rhizobium johnstonii TaxID=3019933 RepID=UPI0013B8FD44|nr:hypothetical protein [Rhizobium leguminosarum]